MNATMFLLPAVLSAWAFVMVRMRWYRQTLVMMAVVGGLVSAFVGFHKLMMPELLDGDNERPLGAACLIGGTLIICLTAYLSSRLAGAK